MSARRAGGRSQAKVALSSRATAARRSAVLAVAAALVSGVAGGCAGPPWFLGEPLDGHASITPGSAKLSWVEQRDLAARAQAAGETVIEIGALLALDDMARLTRAQSTRLVELLWRRARELRARGRVIPASRDLRVVARLALVLPPQLNAARVVVERDAGDAWLALGALAEAAEAYRQAAALGAVGIDFRARAAAGRPPPEDASLEDLERAIAGLPLRAVPLVAGVYLERGGKDAATLARAGEAARQEGMRGLAGRIAAVRAGDAGTAATTDPTATTTTGDTATAAADPTATTSATTNTSTSMLTTVDPEVEKVAKGPIPGDLDRWLLGGPTLAGRLLPLVAAHPKLLDDRARMKRWVDLLLAEDSTSPDVLELAALAFGRAGRFGGTERMLMELVYHTPDRAAGIARGAAVWDQLGRPREACAQWIRAARWRDDPEDPAWRDAVSCTRRDPGAGDWRAIRQYVLERAPAARREAIAAALDAAAEAAGAAMGRAP